MADTTLNRREFLRDISISFAGAGLMLNSFGTQSACGAAPRVVEKPQAGKLGYRTLGKTGLKVSAVSFGVMTLTDPTVLFKALDLGINYFDTAHMYQNGRNEEMLGRILKEYGRSKVFVATKIAPWYKLRSKEKMPMHDQKTMEEKVATSLRRLQTDYVDVLFLHNIVEPEWATYEPMLAFLEKMKRQGKARFIGISFHEGATYVNVTDAWLKANCYDVFLAALNFKSPPEHSEALKRAKNQNLGIIAMKTQAGGYQDAYRGFMSPHQAALAWVLQREFVDCAIPGMVNMEQVVENVGAVGKKLGWSEKKVLNTYYGAIKEYYCCMCGRCTGTCGRRIAVQTINRTLMYYEGYGDVGLARSTYLELGNEENARACLNCVTPTCRCVNGINLAERMRHAHTLFA